MHGLRPEYQDRVNFVVWDWDERAERDLAADLGIARHPAFGLVAPDSKEVEERIFGPLGERTLRELLDETIARHGG